MKSDSGELAREIAQYCCFDWHGDFEQVVTWVQARLESGATNSPQRDTAKLAGKASGGGCRSDKPDETIPHAESGASVGEGAQLETIVEHVGRELGADESQVKAAILRLHQKGVLTIPLDGTVRAGEGAGTMLDAERFPEMPHVEFDTPRDAQLAAKLLNEAHQMYGDYIALSRKWALSHERSCPKWHDTGACNCGLNEFLSRPKEAIQSQLEQSSSSLQAAQDFAQLYRSALIPCYEILEALRMSVQWELAPDLKEKIAKAAKQAATALETK